ncbi:MAG: hypothetical protein ACI4HI_00295 [Lachnospiraceae bacterium]
MIAGFLFGFPMGAQITSKLCETHALSQKESQRILCISNNMGPGFLLGVVAQQTYFCATPTWLLVALLYLPPLLLGRIWYAFDSSLPDNPSKNTNTASRSQITFKIIDAGIMNGFETLTRIGGYLMLFSIFADFIKTIVPNAPLLRCTLVGLTEVTTGIQTLATLPIPDLTKKLLALAFLAFGGLSGIGQTSAFLKNTGTKFQTYVGFKLFCTGSTVFLGFLWFAGAAL